MLERLAYLLASARKKACGQGLACPSCGASGGRIVDKKYAVTSLVRCQSCQLLYRTPTSSNSENHSFYQSGYSQGFTTSLPSDAELAQLIATRFEEKINYQPYIAVLEAVGVERGARLFDFGCSWGYGSWQLSKHGYDVESFEISEARARFARERLGMHVFESMEEVEGPYDVFFTSHVLEHVPSVQATIAAALRLLRGGGLFVAFTPNGSAAHRSKSPTAWRQLWGRVHPQFLDDVHYKNHFRNHVTVMDSAPYKLDELRSWSRTKSKSICLDLDGHELLLVACK